MVKRVSRFQALLVFSGNLILNEAFLPQNSVPSVPIAPRYEVKSKDTFTFMTPSMAPLNNFVRSCHDYPRWGTTIHSHNNAISKEDEHEWDGIPLTNASPESSTSTRRQWMTQTTSSSAALASILSWRTPAAHAAVAAETTAIEASASAEVITSSTSLVNPLCDPTVSILKRGSRTLYLLGTAHISADSAQLAGQLVRQIKPQAVFIELDAKRVGRISSKTTSSSSSSASSSLASTSTTTSESKEISVEEESTPQTPMVRTAPREPSPAPRINPFDFKAKLMQASQALIGNSIKKLYQQLESQGFSAGEEFAIAIREGLAQNATIILGDRDVDVTLRRLTEAFAQTNLQNLLSADSEFEKNMESLMPETMRTNIQSLNGGEMPDADTMSVFVETMKTKENVKQIMNQLNAAAPELYQALVGERDVYMAEGMDKAYMYEDMVSVMGLGHLDGVERNLANWGWKSVKPICGRT